MVYISLVFWIARSLFSESNCQIGGMLDSVRGISNSTVIEVVFYGMFLLDSVRGIYSSCFLEWSVSVFRLQLSDLWYVRFSSRYIQFNCYSSFLWYVSVRFSSWYIFLFFLYWLVSVFHVQLSDWWYVRFSSRYIQFNCYRSSFV
jgi:hypothetical protein